jgi:NADPH-dependent glutamate synthase beta subunit-like oxidoreductase
MSLLEKSGNKRRITNFPGKPLSIDQLLKKFREALFQTTTNDPAEAEAGRTIL